MTDYNGQLDVLFKEWEAASIANGDDVISKDGLMKMKDVDVNEMWDKSPVRVMFLLKDQPNGGGDDIRNWLTLPDSNRFARRNREVHGTFLKRLAFLLYGFVYGSTEFWTIKKEDVIKCFLETPFALVETKKQSGGTSVSNRVMNIYINRYRDFLLKEIEILSPNIIVCCGGPQHHFVLHSLYNIETLETIDGNVHYDPEKKVVIVYSPHPRAHCSHEKFFEGAMWHYGIFLKHYPGWPDIHMTSCPGL